MNPSEGTPSQSLGSRHLRTQVSVMIAVAVSFTVVVLSSYFIHSYEEEAKLQMETNRRTMEADLEQKGMAVARTVTLAIQRALVVMDYLAITEVINTVVKGESDIIYGMAVNKEGVSVVHSDPTKSGIKLTEESDKKVLAVTKMVKRDLLYKNKAVVEIVAPIEGASGRWGIVRFGMSRERLDDAIAIQQSSAEQKIKQDVSSSIWAALFLIGMTSFLGFYWTIRLTRPLEKLIVGVDQVRDGDLETRLEPSGSYEFQKLGNAFNAMTRAVSERDRSLQEEVAVRVRAQADLEDALEVANEANRLKSEFLANVSHELRTPLNSIVNVPRPLMADYSAYLTWNCPQCDATFNDDSEPVPFPEFQPPNESPDCPDCSTGLNAVAKCQYAGDPDDHVYYLGNIEKNGKHLLAVVNDLLDFSKLDAGQLKLSLTSLTVAQLFDTVSTTTTSLVVDKQLDLNYNDDGVALVGDSLKLTQIMINLVGNAIKFTPDKGSVTIAATQIEDDGKEMALFSVGDTGIGIPAEDQENIFESFRQVDGGHTRLHQGTGLGLSITRKLVELHGGRIWVESEVGKGSTFYFKIPLKGPGVFRSVDAAS